jgi:hypothetical protein
MMHENSDPFSSVRINNIEKPPSNNVTEKEDNSSNDPFSSVRIKKNEDIPWLYEAGRHLTRIGSRVAETLGGIPGDISSLIQSGVITGLKKLTGHELSQEGHEEIKKQRLPTSSELKKISQNITKGYTSPQNEAEKIGDEYTELVASLIGPMKFRRALGIAAGSTLAKKGVKLSGLDEGFQEAAKLGSMLMLTSLNPGGAMKYASSQYQKANSLAKGASINASGLKKYAENMLVDLNKGLTSTPKTAVIKPLEEILTKIKANKIPVQELTSAKKDLNTIIKDPSLLKREKKLLNGFGKQIDEAIKPYEKINPAFKKAYRPANEIYSAVMQGTKASDFIGKVLGNKSVLGLAIGEAALGHSDLILPTVAGAIGAKGTAKTVDFFTRLAKSTELQKYYSKAMAAAIAEDVGALRFYSDKIEEEFNKK